MKKGDLYSPAIFILFAEVLSIALNFIFHNVELKGFVFRKWNDNINQLDYIDDIVIFVSTNKKALNLMMDVPRDYKPQSGQLIHKEKNAFLLYQKTNHVHIRE